MTRSNFTRFDHRANLTLASSQDNPQAMPCVTHHHAKDLPTFAELTAEQEATVALEFSAAQEKTLIRQSALHQLEERIANLRERYSDKDWLPYPELLTDVQLSAYAEKWDVDYEGVLMTCCCNKMSVTSASLQNRRTRYAMKKWYGRQPVTYVDLRVEIICALKNIVEHKTGSRHPLPFQI